MESANQSAEHERQKLAGAYFIDSTCPEIIALKSFFTPASQEGPTFLFKTCKYFQYLLACSVPAALTGFAGTMLAPQPVKRYGTWWTQIANMLVVSVVLPIAGINVMGYGMPGHISTAKIRDNLIAALFNMCTFAFLSVNAMAYVMDFTSFGEIS